MKTLHVMP